MTRVLETVLWIQGIYFLVTGIWPLVSYSSFEAITGRKTDVWLVKTAGALLAVTGAALLNAVVATAPVTITVFITGIGTAMVLLMIDLEYVAKSVISKIYLVDACIQFLLVMLWCISIF